MATKRTKRPTLDSAIGDMVKVIERFQRETDGEFKFSLSFEPKPKPPKFTTTAGKTDGYSIGTAMARG
jgi:hypothetical protein